MERDHSFDKAGCQRRTLVTMAAVASLGLSAGCQQVLFPADTPRTQFELHDRLHNQYTPTEVPDAFGNPQPALRARLSRKYGS